MLLLWIGHATLSIYDHLNNSPITQLTDLQLLNQTDQFTNLQIKYTKLTNLQMYKFTNQINQFTNLQTKLTNLQIYKPN